MKELSQQVDGFLCSMFFSWSAVPDAESMKEKVGVAFTVVFVVLYVFVYVCVLAMPVFAEWTGRMCY